MRKIYFTGLMLSMALAGNSADYTTLNGLQGAALKAEVKKIASQHKEISYGDKTWDAFSQSDVRLITDPSIDNGEGGHSREAWFDMYSNRLVWVSTGHSGMNIEHAVANSWWGGEKNKAYKDLHHLNPSDADANNRKNNNPLGVIDGIPTWSNGLTNIGVPKMNYGGGSTSVFEPADEYKGDFARAYFYIFTIYDDINWQPAPACMYDLTAYPTLQPWAYEMLLEWAAADPVDEREAKRNQTVARIQENENPFISIPGLAEYIWGSKRNTPFNLAEAQTAPLPDRPNAPAFRYAGDYDLAGVNTWTGRWWNAFDLEVEPTDGSKENMYYTFSATGNEDWHPYEGSIKIAAATASGETKTIRMYAERESEPGRRSSISTLTLTAVEEGATDYRDARWVKVKDISEIDCESQYIIVASKASEVMSTSKGTGMFITVAGNVEPNSKGEITRVPEGTAVIEFVEAGGEEYYVEVNDLGLNPIGYLSTTEAKKIQISEEGMGVVLSLTPEKNLKMSFGQSYGTLQYNAQQPRFCVYTSKQQAVDLYKCAEQGSTGVRLPAEDACNYGNGSCGADRIYTIAGVEIRNKSEKELPAGIYLIVNEKGVRKVCK